MNSRTLSTIALGASAIANSASFAGIPVKFWNPTGYTNTGLLSQGDFPRYNEAPVYKQINDGIGGTVGYGYQFATATTFAWGQVPSPNVADPFGSTVFGTGDQSQFSLAAGSTVNSVRQKSPQGSPSFRVNFDFSNYHASAMGAESDGATFGGTMLGFSDFFSGNQYTNTVLTITATRLGGGDVNYGTWTLFVADAGTGNGGLGGGNKPYQDMSYTPGSASGVIDGLLTRSTGGNAADGIGYDTTFGLLKLSDTERYTKITVTVQSTAFASGGAENMAFYLATAQVPAPGALALLGVAGLTAGRRRRS
jgi:MYXO-CTERM domain-containing protein